MTLQHAPLAFPHLVLDLSEPLRQFRLALLELFLQPFLTTHYKSSLLLAVSFTTRFRYYRSSLLITRLTPVYPDY